MMIFDFRNYRAFLRKKVESYPKKGHGQFRKIAQHLGIQTSMLSQVMGGQRELNAESAVLICDYFGMSELETDYFLLLVQNERAGNPRLRAHLERQMETLRKQAMEIDRRIPKKTQLSEATKAMFYSQWYYSGVRLASAMDGVHSVDAIARCLGLPNAVVGKVVSFLLESGLCVQEGGKIKPGPQSTHLASDSPMVTRHHMNWRLKAMEGYERLSQEELLFTGPAAISRKDGMKIKKLLLETIDQWAKTVDASGSEKLTCLNIDWIDLTR